MQMSIHPIGLIRRVGTSLVMPVLLLGLFLAALPGSWGQSDQTAPAPTSATRPATKKVWTNEDLKNLGDAGVSVLGAPGNQAQVNSRKPDQAQDSDACESDAWAAAVTIILKQQGLAMSPQFWADKLFNAPCVTGVRLTKVGTGIEGNYTLENGRKIQVKSEALPGVPAGADLVAAMREKHSLLLQYQGQPWVSGNVEYIDNQYADGGKVYTVSRLILVDPLSGKKQVLDFSAQPAPVVQGSLQVKVIPVQ